MKKLTYPQPTKASLYAPFLSLEFLKKPPCFCGLSLRSIKVTDLAAVINVPHHKSGDILKSDCLWAPRQGGGCPGKHGVHHGCGPGGCHQ